MVSVSERYRLVFRVDVLPRHTTGVHKPQGRLPWEYHIPPSQVRDIGDETPLPARVAQLAGLVVRCAELRRHHGPLGLVSRRRLLVYRPFGFAGAFVCCSQETRRKYNPSSRLVLYGCAAASVDDRCSNSTVAGFNFEWDQVPFIPYTILLPCKPPCTWKEIEKTSGM